MPTVCGLAIGVPASALDTDSGATNGRATSIKRVSRGALTQPMVGAGVALRIEGVMVGDRRRKVIRRWGEWRGLRGGAEGQAFANSRAVVVTVSVIAESVLITGTRVVTRVVRRRLQQVVVLAKSALRLLSTKTRLGQGLLEGLKATNRLGPRRAPRLSLPDGTAAQQVFN